MNRAELIALGEKIVAAKGTESEHHALMNLFDQHVPHPNGANLFYWPEKSGRDFDKSTYNPTVEEVVDLCLAYKPIQL